MYTILENYKLDPNIVNVTPIANLTLLEPNDLLKSKGVSNVLDLTRYMISIINPKNKEDIIKKVIWLIRYVKLYNFKKIFIGYEPYLVFDLIREGRMEGLKIFTFIRGENGELIDIVEV